MTNAELIERLKKLPLDLVVVRAEHGRYVSVARPMVKSDRSIGWVEIPGSKVIAL